MPRQNRAKLFAPYDALKGFEETVHAKESAYVQRTELTEYAQECLDRALRRLRRGDRVTVTWFRPKTPDTGQYVSVSGAVTRIDAVFRTLTVGGQVIRMTDLLAVETAPPRSDL